MTTTAFDDQFTPSTQTTEPARQPYDTGSILRRNVADLELALKQQTERAEAAEEKLTTARDDMQSWIDSRNGWMERAGAAEAEMAKLREQKQKPMGWIDADGDFYHGRHYPNVWPTAVPVYAAPVPAPAVPELDPMNRLIVSDPKQPKSPQQATSVPKEWRDYVFAAADELRLTVRDLKNGFVRCGNCGEQETTSDLDCVSDIDGALELLDGLLQSAPQAPAVPELDPMTRLIVSDPKQPKPTALQAPAVPVYLLERQENGLSWYIGATTCFGGAWHWTADVNSAIRFSREEDAAACWNIIARHHIGIGGSGTTETTPKQHIFDVRTLLQSAEGSNAAADRLLEGEE